MYCSWLGDNTFVLRGIRDIAMYQTRHVAGCESRLEDRAETRVYQTRAYDADQILRKPHGFVLPRCHARVTKTPNLRRQCARCNFDMTLRYHHSSHRHFHRLTSDY